MDYPFTSSTSECGGHKRGSVGGQAMLGSSVRYNKVRPECELLRTSYHPVPTVTTLGPLKHGYGVHVFAWESIP